LFFSSILAASVVFGIFSHLAASFVVLYFDIHLFIILVDLSGLLWTDILPCLVVYIKIYQCIEFF
jgi:hypothetical protein